MCDRVRYTSVPPGGAAADATMANPAYSSTIISTASETGSVTTTEPIFEKVEIELAPFTKRILSEPKHIKLIILSLIGLVSILLLLNITLILLWPTQNSSQSLPINEDAEHVNSNVSTEILLSTTAEVPTTTLHPATTPESTPSIDNETLNWEYRYFTRRFNRPKSNVGLQNFADNYAFFTTNGKGMTVAETQFSDVALNELKKVVNTNRDSSRAEDRFACRKVSDFILSDTMSFIFDLHNTSRIPARIDLRRNSTMPNVRNQGTSCNGGYAFSTVAQMDYLNGKSYSVQYLLCDSHNFHCQGGEPFKSRQTVNTVGIPDDIKLPFSENQKWCDNAYDLQKHSSPPCFASSFIYSYSNRTQDRLVTATELISSILNRYAPPIVEVPVDRSFFFYKAGIYRPNCDEIIGYQPAIVVGYDKRDGVDVWILRNSFGTDWGIDGDFEMEKGVKANNDCDAFAYAIY